MPTIRRPDTFGWDEIGEYFGGASRATLLRWKRRKPAFRKLLIQLGGRYVSACSSELIRFRETDPEARHFCEFRGLCTGRK